MAVMTMMTVLISSLFFCLANTCTPPGGNLLGLTDSVVNAVDIDDGA